MLKEYVSLREQDLDGERTSHMCSDKEFTRKVTRQTAYDLELSPIEWTRLHSVEENSIATANRTWTRLYIVQMQSHSHTVYEFDKRRCGNATAPQTFSIQRSTNTNDAVTPSATPQNAYSPLKYPRSRIPPVRRDNQLISTQMVTMRTVMTRLMIYGYSGHTEDQYNRL